MRTINLLTAIAIFVMAMSSCNSTSSNDNNFTPPKPKTAEELREDLKLQEQSASAQYLSVKSTLRENITQKPDLFHHTKKDGFILSGTVTNSASIAKFKDIVITVSYLSDTDTEMETTEYIMYKYFNPSSVTDFEYKVYPPSGFKNFHVEVLKATAAN